MKKRTLLEILITMLMLCGCFGLGLFIQSVFKSNALIPAIFILGSFLTSLFTDGYIFGIISALLGMLAVNFAFTFPFFAFNFTILENIISAAILLIVSVVTCSLTTKIKKQEAIKIESEKEKMRANLLRAISHDLRTPLTTICGSSSILLDNFGEFDNEQCRKILEGIKEESQWLSRMVENLLSITRLDGDNVRIIKTETVLDELVDSILVKFAKRYPDVAVKVDIPDEFITIPMDAILIEQVVINILENAVQHAKGFTELSFKVTATSDKAVFEICDNGCGISEDRLKDIFVGTFIPENSTADSEKNNAGIGLSVCATIIKAHGGEITAENLKTGGCVFRFILSTEGCENE